MTACRLKCPAPVCNPISDAGLRRHQLHYLLTREPLRIANVSAGGNEDQARNSFDDDETTDWSSAGPLPTAWIKYDFARAVPVNEVVIKLVAWRTQSYPIRVSVDNTVVFEGQTPRTLGYVTLSFKPVVGKSLKIELTRDASNRDAFGNIIEIPGNRIQIPPPAGKQVQRQSGLSR